MNIVTNGEKRITCLDKGFVELLDWKGSDLDIARAARVLPQAPWREVEDPKLLAYMLRNRHNTPFEHVVFTFWVKAPIFVYRQWHRHRTQSYNEQSARYMEMDGEYYVPSVETIGVQSVKNHQARVIGDMPEGGRQQRELQLEHYKAACDAAIRTYRMLLEEGWPRELARMVLPVSVYSQMTTTVNLHNLFNFLSLRNDPGHAQHEIVVYAQAMQQLIRPIVPIALATWEKLRRTD